MQIVIDIDEKYYELLKHDVLVNRNDYKPIVLIAKGKPLPAGHGRLIDEKELGNTIARMWENRKLTNTKYNTFLGILDYIPTVIEADGCKWDENQKRDCHTCHYMSENAEFDGEMCVGCLADLSGSKPCYKERQKAEADGGDKE